MAYSANGRKPMERASKIAHREIINNPDVAAYLQGCTLPAAPASADLSQYVHAVQPVATPEVRAVIAIDGGFTETPIREEFPSAALTFFTFGPLLFRLDDLRRLDGQRFLAPEDLAKLKKLERHTLVLPTRGVRLTSESSLASTVRRTIYQFFTRPNGPQEDPLIKSLVWFLFRRWEETPDPTREETLERCPNPRCGQRRLVFRYDSPTSAPCPGCGAPVYLTDVFRLHERVDEEQGAGGIVSYVMSVLEQLVLVHLIRTIWTMKRSLLAEILFVKDGPLAFFGVTAPLSRPMRELVGFLLGRPADEHGGREPCLHLVGAEKSGAFVDHAAAIERQVPAGTVLIPDNAYIHRYIVPGDPAADIYGRNTYYGQKALFKSQSGDMHVLTIPTRAYSANPTPEDFPNLGTILQLVTELRCAMYDNALVPIALANKLVSLSDFPSQRILTTFARQGLA